jgi:putative phage-type endonuclease
MTSLYEIVDLKNIIDEIIPEELESIFTEENTLDFIETLLLIMKEYVDDNPQAVMEQDFEYTFKEDILELLEVHFEDHLFLDEELEDDIEEIIDFTFNIFFNTIYQSRSLNRNTESIENVDCIQELQDKIDLLRSKPQPAQRTNEWYQFRYNLITASSAHKIFESQSCVNQLIYEKCQPLKIEENSLTMVNVNTTLHWGQKYEPLSVMIYENIYNTKVGDFGCIQHDTYSFLGASPDGINIDSTSPLFGRMLEIKNIVNREITGVPLREYWIQMQLQMEVCDLDDCDFLETKFVEYEKESDFYEDTNPDTIQGVIMYFQTEQLKPHYVYKPLHITENIIEWEESTLDYQTQHNMIWIKNIYWKLEKMSCVLVTRNKTWFQDNISSIENVWRIIEKERIDGCEHRAPKKRAKKETDRNSTGFNGCFLVKT